MYIRCRYFCDCNTNSIKCDIVLVFCVYWILDEIDSESKMKLDPPTRYSIISSVIYFGIFGKRDSQNRYNVKAISAIYFKEGIEF